MKNVKNKIILTGDRPTGKLHLGHYAGSLSNRVVLQENNKQTILIADMQGLTDNGTNPEKISSNILNLMADYLSIGIDPSKTDICLQSAIPELAELTMFYSNIVSVSRLERNPTVRSEIKSIQERNNEDFNRSIPAGFLNYPISQAADITAFKANLIPVGDDQLPMIEQTNEIVKKMNNIAKKNILVPCDYLLSNVSRLPSIDGKSKMSKSAGGTITFDMSNSDIKKMVNKMFTDPNHLTIESKGTVEGNVVFSYLDAFYKNKNHLEELKSHYRRGGLGDGTTKKLLTEVLISLLEPIREKRLELINHNYYLIEVLKKGTEASRHVTSNTVGEVKKSFGLNLF